VNGLMDGMKVEAAVNGTMDESMKANGKLEWHTVSVWKHIPMAGSAIRASGSRMSPFASRECSNIW
jgi:hypothetical protein